jgi:hypothetical protein
LRRCCGAAIIYPLQLVQIASNHRSVVRIANH